MTDTRYIKSALNYTGGKYKLLPQLAPLFPKDKVNTFYDVFCGGATVAVNAMKITDCQDILANDIEPHIISLYEYLSQQKDTNALVAKVKTEISRRGFSDTFANGYGYYGVDSSAGLGKVNKNAFNKLRDDYNALAASAPDKDLLFYLLIVFAFNNQVRFNANGDYNLPVGKRDFNASMEKKLCEFTGSLIASPYKFTNSDFREIISQAGEGDFLYCDPPYLITVAGYNENGGWTQQDDLDLMSTLDDAFNRGARFALSNVSEHKGRRNEVLLSWAGKYNLHLLDFDYNNSNYHSQAKTAKTQEVLITSY